MKIEKLTSLKKDYEEFKQTDVYKFRVKQSVVSNIHKEIIIATLKNEPLENIHLTGLIQMFKYGCSDATFDKYLAINVSDDLERTKLSEKAYELEEWGYTGAGLNAVSGLTPSQLTEIKTFLLKSLNISTIAEAQQLCNDFEQLKIPLIKVGIYSPWLYYIKPDLFPILNNSHSAFLRHLEIPNKYAEVISAFNEINKEFGETDLGYIDAFAHTYTNPESALDKNVTEQRSFYKYAPGVQASRWAIDVAQGEMSVDYKEYNFDVSAVASLEELNMRVGLEPKASANTTWNLFLFKNAKVGDVIFANKGKNGLVGVGIISGDYRFDETRNEFKHTRKVNWVINQEWNYQPNRIRDYQTLFRPDTFSPTLPYKGILSLLRQDYPSLVAILKKHKLFFDSVFSEEQSNHNSTMKTPLNQILYGPPGTGKTYHTINKALAIIENKAEEELAKEDRAVLKQRYQEYVAKGQIVFTTFHQSMSYEDFVEGIKPEIEEDKDGVRSVVYDIKDGIFKSLCKEASVARTKEAQQAAYGFDDAWNELLANLQNNDRNDDFILEILTPNKGFKVTEVTNNGNLRLTPKSIDGLEYTVSYNRAKKLQAAFPDLTVVKNIDKEFRAVIGGSNSTAYWAVLNVINKKLAVKQSKEELVASALTPYVLIIDEINRGNVSAIFGELITLIEESKRKPINERHKERCNETLEVTLPYSKEKFSVPSNLYIIGTMNTADRSVEALDTALRRRFAFEEMMPKYDLLKSDDYRYSQLISFHKKYDAVKWEDWAKDYTVMAKNFYSSIGLEFEINSKDEHRLYHLIRENDFKDYNAHIILGEFVFKDMFDLSVLLKTLNKRISILYDREHQIGHSYFLKIKDRMSPYAELRHCFRNEIIPLLQEYFFGDYEKIALVLGEDFVIKSEYKADVFAKFKGTSGLDFLKPTYSINDKTLANDDEFKKGIDKLLGVKEPEVIVLEEQE